MNAEFFAAAPHAASSPSQEVSIGKAPRARRIHRWIAVIFTLSVAVNFAVMPWGQPPAWITFAPLPPLLFLMVTGLVMLVSSWLPRNRAMQQGAGR